MTNVPSYPTSHGLLDGKSVVITAAAGAGIGFATAKRCVEEGARVAIGDIHERRLAEAAEQLAAIGGEKPPAGPWQGTHEGRIHPVARPPLHPLRPRHRVGHKPRPRR